MALKLISVIVLALTISANVNAIQYSDKGSPKQPTVRAEDAALKTNFKKLETYLDTIADNDKLMGSVALRENGKIIFEHQFGYMDVAAKRPPDVNTKYQIGSISKTYTAALIMQMIEKGKLELTDTLDGFFPSIPNAKKITIHQLLRHESGLFNFTNDPSYMSYMTLKQSRKKMLERIEAFDVQFEPGIQHEYSNTNYILLSYILEDLSKQSFAELLTSKIVNPLGLKHTIFGDGVQPDKNDAYSYAFKGEWQLEAETEMGIPTGAGAISASPADLTLFYHALFNNKVVNADSLTKMIKPKSYGYALAAMPFYEKTAYGHGGRIDGFTSNAAYIQDDNLAIALTTNGVNMNVNDAMIAILSAYYDKPFDIPVFKAKEPVGDFDLNDYVGNYGSKQIPLKISVFIQDETLMAQATGQGAIPLTATAKDEFSFSPAGIEMRFDIEKATFNLHQGGGVFLFSKEKTTSD